MKGTTNNCFSSLSRPKAFHGIFLIHFTLVESISQELENTYSDRCHLSLQWFVWTGYTSQFCLLVLFCHWKHLMYLHLIKYVWNVIQGCLYLINKSLWNKVVIFNDKIGVNQINQQNSGRLKVIGSVFFHKWGVSWRHCLWEGSHFLVVTDYIVYPWSTQQIKALIICQV